ncbi:hypothetical protein T040910_144 [Synechococcus phage S-CAM3]|uniref:Uncharacterized protein n=1 Tax=Synechococcus phage S-CAM3 TaxID=1883366 RepID=A0A1D8KKK5_9CAUD|nr:hypothetical protein BOW87_gp114 [Synechococcus phage S-CAM3]AOV58648.1 hypothetical protein S250808_143 [Synechococcus phage S-CAM3]AOV58888.1 hypothetical protein T040910_144 [Synechococcus phage S-CAM3]AOV59127.1 hypothetical protein C421010_144 [Synechococcus phage S-CAM3]
MFTIMATAAEREAQAAQAAKEPEVKKPSGKPSGFKIFISTVGALFAISHLGLLGYLIDRKAEPEVPQVPTINIPRGDYSSYTIEAGPSGYKIQYKANDPAILESEKSLNLDQEKKGLFGRGGTEKRTEYRRDQYTMDGTRNIGGGEIGEVGKTGGVSAECIAADAGARSQGAMAGSAIAAGVAVPAAMSIPYVGWLAGGWALLLGQKAGSSLGSTVGQVFNDC